jgi:H+/gluconate symporter-like permease
MDSSMGGCRKVWFPGKGRAICNVNDTGFWRFKEYFCLTVPQTLRSWTMMEAVVDLIGLVGCSGLPTVV